MQKRSSKSDVVVIGGGAIGLAIAWRAAQRGLRVTVLERGEPGRGSSWVAAGMLAPIAEARLSEERLLRLSLAGVAEYPRFAHDLAEASGMQLGYLRCGTLLAARDGDEAEALERELRVRLDLGLGVRRLRPSEARRLEPALAPALRLALEVPDDHAIDPRRLTAALADAGARAGVELRSQTEAIAVVCSSAGRVTGVRLGDGEQLEVEHVVVAAGAWSAKLAGIPEDARVDVRPVKGQLMRLHDPSGPGLLTRVLRMAGGGAYVVPRGDGRYVLGATMEERGYDTTVTAGAMFELLREAIELVPGVAELVVDELGAGLRPATADNAPAIGRSAVPGLSWAVGHHRNGILLAPITAEILVAELTGEEPPEIAGEFSPARFTAPAGVGA